MALSAKSLKVGDTHQEVVVDNLTRTQLVQYAGASGDYNPIHNRRGVHHPGGGLSVGIRPRHAFHGLDRQDADQLRRRRPVSPPFGVRFTRQVWPGDTLTASATVQAVREEAGVHFVDLVVSTVNQDDTEVVSGYASARVDA